MPDEVQAEINSIKLQIGLMEKDVNSLGKLCDKLTESIERVQELNVSFMKMLSVYDHKHLTHDTIESDIKVDIKELHSRISTVNREFNVRITKLEHNLSGKLDSLRTELLEQDTTLQEKQDIKVNNTLGEFTKYKWMIIGGAAVLGWLIGNIGNITKFISLFF